MSNNYETNFRDLPHFPEDVPTAPLLRLTLQGLLDHDDGETDRLWQACTELGFFYLDCRGASVLSTSDNHSSNDASASLNGDEFLQDAYDLFSVADSFFDLPLPQKLSFDVKLRKSFFGYKGKGTAVIDAKGNKDRNEAYNISKDDILELAGSPYANTGLPTPSVLESAKPLLKRYIQSSHAIALIVLGLLGSKLSLKPGELESMHNLQRTSGDLVRFIRSPPQPVDDRQTALGAHTDFGSITLLFNRVGGLQILPSSSEGENTWLYVRPLPGHCIVNLGDAMVKFTRGALRSNMHRVVNPPGAQSESVRTSLVYFSRPEDDVLLKPLTSDLIDARRAQMNEGRQEEEEEISSREWQLRRVFARRGNVSDFKLSGGTEHTKIHA